MVSFFTLFIIHVLLMSASCTSSSSSEEEEQSGEQHSNSSSHGHWEYKDQDAWSEAFQDCRGTSQSPINIDTQRAVYDHKLPAITLEGYNLTDGHGLTLLNNGHTLQLSLPGTLRIVSGFDAVFLASQLHFHWGTVEVPGSEHTVDKVHFPAEIHVVHYNSKYADISEAASKPDGLVVLGGFIGVGLHDNKNYENIMDALMDVSNEESNTEIPGFNIRDLLPSNLDRFYRYAGSLTTPPCYQSVSWTLFNETIAVSRRQLASLEETLKAGMCQHLNKNFRAPQLLHGREVLASFPASTLRGNADTFNEHNAEADILDNNPLSSVGIGNILAICFGLLFSATLICFIIYRYRQRKKYRFVKDSRQNVIYMPGNREELGTVDPCSHQS